MESFHYSTSCNSDWPEVAVFLVCLFWAHGFPSDVLHGAGCSRLLGQHSDVSAVDVMSPIRADHVSSEFWMPTIGGNRNVHPPPSSHFSSWSLHSVSVSAAGLAIAWQRGWRKMALWRRLRAAYPKRKYPSTSQQLSLSLDYAGLQPQMGFGIDTHIELWIYHLWVLPHRALTARTFTCYYIFIISWCNHEQSSGGCLRLILMHLSWDRFGSEMSRQGQTRQDNGDSTNQGAINHKP